MRRILLLSLFFRAALLFGAELDATASLEREEIPLGGETAVLVNVRWKGGSDALLLRSMTPPEGEGLTLVDSSASVTTLLLDGIETTEEEHLFVLRAEQEGPARVSPVELTFGRLPDGGAPVVWKSDPFELTVVSAASHRIRDWIGWISAVALVLFGAGGSLAWRKRSRRKKATYDRGG